MTDELTQPAYYQHSILGDTTEYVKHMPYFQGAAFKYVLRAGNKPGVPAEHDLRKALECLTLVTRLSTPMSRIPEQLLDRTGRYATQDVKERNPLKFIETRFEHMRAIVLHEIASAYRVGSIIADIKELIRLREMQETPSSIRLVKKPLSRTKTVKQEQEEGAE